MANPLGRGNIKDLTGISTSTFSILERAVNRKSKSTDRIYVQWKCLCHCGQEFNLTTKQFNRGQKSCGCLKTTKGKSKYTDKQAIARKVFSHYKVGAIRRNLEWNLNIEEFENLIYSNCYYCGIIPSRSCKNYLKNCKEVLVNGIDRKDSNSGYYIMNCITCCKNCNYAKGNSCMEEFETWIQNLVKFRTL